MKQWFEIKERVEQLQNKYHINSDEPMIIVNPERQEMYLVKNLNIQKIYPISTGKSGIGNEIDSGKTPYGTHRISEKFGQNAKWGTVFKARKPTDIIAKVLTEKISVEEDGILTRIMWLDGMEIGVNKNGNVDTHNRYIYIHGTPEEGFIGEPVSHGCIRMKNADIIELFDEVSIGTFIEILNKEYKKKENMLNNNELYKKSCEYLKILCEEIPERSVGSNGNRKATSFFTKILKSFYWQIKIAGFDAIDWNDGGAILTLDDKQLHVLVSPYSLGCDIKAEIVSIRTIDELKVKNSQDKILFLHGEIAKEQLMPKNFVFYNPLEHQEIIALLENSGAAAIICATGRNAALAGGVYPFPLIEDGDFDIPSVFMTEEEGKKLENYIGKQAHLLSRSERICGKNYNVIGKKCPENSKRIVISAHIDAKKGTPGAIDNATGVIVLLLLAELMEDYAGEYQLEIVAFNGEDYYCAPGQMKYLEANQGKFDSILLNINIDGAGYKDGKSSFSVFDLPDNIQSIIESIIDEHEDIGFAEKWYQGDHSIFLQNGCPAIAISSQWFVENIEFQDITHTPKDNVDIVDCRKIVDIARVIQELIKRMDR